ncbi:AglZ/HisF2 family acetamidino modification protein [Muricauda brasiliensis]|uniref:AglZ/HisF2 family acetamidino modification protein n=1 Tax=Muricauda brasiliensis TaxID=2162892 RepID=UPI000D3DC0DE|nr:AglZ/HisF2 family acetamidino modification protein [Muricauda brasiliensis]
MSLKRIIPCLLLRDSGLVKTVKFKKTTYIGDPINAVKIFNEKEVDELIFLDIDATRNKTEPPYQAIQDIATECFMPFCYGGGVNNVEQIRKLLASGAEKIAINTAAFKDPNFIRNAVSIFGSSTIVVSIDYKKNLFGKPVVYVNGGRTSTKKNLLNYVKEIEMLGVGEILLNSIDRDGTMEGYDIGMIKDVSVSVEIPVVACGGAGNMDDLKQVLAQTEVTGVAAGSMFIYQGKKRGVLISYPNQEEIKNIIN